MMYDSDYPRDDEFDELGQERPIADWTPWNTEDPTDEDLERLAFGRADRYEDESDEPTPFDSSGS